MTNFPDALPADYWQKMEITKQDIEFLHSYLFDIETPQTVVELVPVLVKERIRYEQEVFLKKKEAGGKIYFPKEKYVVGDEMVFPAMEWMKGKVISIKAGVNPAVGDFDVLTVIMEASDEHQFAAQLDNHSLNVSLESLIKKDDLDPLTIVQTYRIDLEKKLDAALQADTGLVRIAGSWFPRSLLVKVNLGHLNLAEAVLDLAKGEPLPTADLLTDIELPDGVNPKLAEFSLNLALQDDPRFDEVGPTGQVLWCLQRLEPKEVREIPSYLRYIPIEHDRSVLMDDMLTLETQLDDELSEGSHQIIQPDDDEVVISLIYPHWRVGTLPILTRGRSFFPTAYESPRIRFTLVDGKTGEKMPAWVVKHSCYVFGLHDWYKSNELIPGSLIRLRHGIKPGEVIIEAKARRATRDWIRTVIVGADGGMVFALLKQVITADYNDRMVIAVSDVEAIDKLWFQSSKSRQSFEQIIINVMRELTKLNPQGHVHAQELYSVVNIIRRCPPAPIFCMLAACSKIIHVGDLYFRLDESS